MVSHLSNWAAVPGRQEEERDHVNLKQRSWSSTSYKSIPTLFLTLPPLPRGQHASPASNSLLPPAELCPLPLPPPSAAELWLHLRLLLARNQRRHLNLHASLTLDRAQRSLICSAGESDPHAPAARQNGESSGPPLGYAHPGQGDSGPAAASYQGVTAGPPPPWQVTEARPDSAG